MPRIYFSPPHMSGFELELVNDAFASNWIAPQGPQVGAAWWAVAAERARPLTLIVSPHAGRGNRGGRATGRRR